MDPMMLINYPIDVLSKIIMKVAKISPIIIFALMLYVCNEMRLKHLGKELVSKKIFNYLHKKINKFKKKIVERGEKS